MRIELLNQSKYRHGPRPGDDVPLVVPGVVFGVFDGATDALGTMVEGLSAGRLAALTVAAEMAALAADPDARHMPVHEIVRRLTKTLRNRTAPLGLAIPPSTTVAVMLDCGTSWRFLLLGDTGIRINGSEVLCHNKLIDTVSTEARVRVFRLLRSRLGGGDEVEYATRRVIMLGLDTAISEQVLSEAKADALVEEVIQSTGLDAHASVIDSFLRGGIKTQFTFGNANGSLAFDTMNGTEVPLRDVIDQTRPKDEVASVEIFTDGYPAMPKDVSPHAWEEAFAKAERRDYHKIETHAAVKGSTEAEYFDDRTVLILSDMVEQGKRDSH